MLRVLPLLLLAGCAGPQAVDLQSQVTTSFAHLGGARICLLGSDWALEAFFDGGFPESGQSSQSPGSCFLYRGAVSGCFRPSGGGPDASHLAKEKLARVPVEDLTVTGCGGSLRGEGSARFAFSAFTADGVRYAPMAVRDIEIRGPYP